MRIPRVYADTSVYGGAFDEKFEAASKAFFEQVRKGRFILVTSAVVEQEVQRSPLPVQELFAEFLPEAEMAEASEEVLSLQYGYVKSGVVTEKSLTDALHVALATVNGCQIIVSWNFKHIVHFQKIPQYNAVNVLRGYGNIAIHSPQEVIEDEDEDI